MAQAASAFRTAFKTVSKDLLNWFPGHMEKGMKQMQHRLRQIDLIIEVHDARIPISGRNPNFKYVLGAGAVKPHILVLNKVDLIDRKLIPAICDRLKNECDHVIFTNCKEQKKCPGIRKLFPLSQKLIEQADRYNRAGAEDLCALIIGIPNVGKSSLINALRVKHLNKGNATHVGALPGITRSVLTKIKISEKPMFYLLDTPGVIDPKIPDVEVGLKLALCNTINNHMIGASTIADYLLYYLNKHIKFAYVKKLGLNESNDTILDVLAEVAMKNGRVLKFKDPVNGGYVMRPDIEKAAEFMIKMFREGDLGKIMLDEDLL